MNTLKPIIKKWERAKLMFTDTDYLCYHIQSANIYIDMEQNRDLFDFSDYLKNHSLYSEKNKKVIGKFKDELNGDQCSGICRPYD